MVRRWVWDSDTVGSIPTISTKRLWDCKISGCILINPLLAKTVLTFPHGLMAGRGALDAKVVVRIYVWELPRNGFDDIRHQAGLIAILL
jgi:hypothetical protein